MGYADERGDAIDLVTKWYRKYCGLDARTESPAWFRELIVDAMHVQGSASEDAGGLKWDN